jgi:hypothetical protein
VQVQPTQSDATPGLAALPPCPQAARFPLKIDACSVLGAWGVFCLGFLLPTILVMVTEKRARARWALLAAAAHV